VLQVTAPLAFLLVARAADMPGLDQQITYVTVKIDTP
jgi:hypothetical protein